jgi:hypothetical protein
MNSNSKEFIDYLQYIGFLSKNSINNFLTILNNEIENTNNYNNNNSNILLNSIINFLSNLTNNDIKNLANGLLERFNENKKKIKEKYLQKLLEIYENKFLFYFLNKWKNKKYFNHHHKISSYIENNYSTNSYKFLNNNNNNNSYKKNLSYKNLKHASNNFIINNSTNPNLKEDFFSRLKNYSKKAQDNIEKNIIRSENELKQLCSFSPKVNSNTKNVKSKYNKINSNKDLKSNNYRKNSNSKLSTLSNKEAIDRLYNDYKDSQIRKKNLQKEIDEERGLTFKPKIFTEKNGFLIEDNFEERNKKLLEDRKNFAFVYDYLRQKELSENSVGGGKTNDLLQSYINRNNQMKENPNYEILLGQNNFYNY